MLPMVSSYNIQILLIYVFSQFNITISFTFIICDIFNKYSEQYNKLASVILYYFNIFLQKTRMNLHYFNIYMNYFEHTIK